MKQLVFTGDSLTAGGDWQRRFPDYAVANLGISGETVEGLLARRDRIRAQVENPDTLFLMTGINNIASEQYDINVLYRELVATSPPGTNSQPSWSRASCPLS